MNKMHAFCRTFSVSVPLQRQIPVLQFGRVTISHFIERRDWPPGGVGVYRACKQATSHVQQVSS